jgi:hypothetical protein
MPPRKLIIRSWVSWPANAGRPVDVRTFAKKNLGGPVKPGHDNHCVVC